MIYSLSPFFQGSDVSGYDEYIEGVEPDEATSLDKPISEVAKMSWLRSCARLSNN